MSKRLILVNSVVVGGPTLDKEGKVTKSNERTLEPGTVADFDDKVADRLIMLGAARPAVVEAEPVAGA